MLRIPLLLMVSLLVLNLRGAESDDLQSLFAGEMRVCKLDEVQRHSPMGCPTEISPVLVPVKPKSWQEWVLEQQVTQATQGRSTGKRRAFVQPGQLSIWGVGLEEGRTKDQ